MSFDIINTSCFGELTLTHSYTGFCSTLINVLGLIDFCERNNCSFILPQNPELWFFQYKKTDPNNDSLFDSIFDRKSFASLKTENTKPYNAFIGMPPSPIPFFFSNMTTDESLYVSPYWRKRLNQCLSQISFSDDIQNKIKEDANTYSILTEENSVGIHIRGTDTTLHGKLNLITDRIDRAYELSKNYKWVFLATDEEHILRLCKEKFGERLIYLEDTKRSPDKTPIHEGYKYGVSFDTKNNLINLIREVYILSKTNSLILSRSAIGDFVLTVNPDINFSLLDTIGKNHDVYKYRDRLLHNAVDHVLEIEKINNDVFFNTKIK